jgi:hypothetical protein
LGRASARGCGSKDEPGAPAKAKAGSGSAGAVAPTTAGSGSGSATASGSGSGSGAPTKAPVAKLAKADVEAVLAAWLAAQTSGTYDAYAQLYADKFEGVRRSGPRVRRFDRAGWLADRKRMFAKPMTVSTSAPAISMAGAMATVDVVQTFAQGTFKDVGPKRLIVVATAAGAKIAREEMLASELVRDAAKPDDNIYLVTDIGNEELVLLGGGDRTWGAGPVSRFTSTTDPFLSIQAASKLPPEQAAWTGKRLRGYATDGTSCEITLGALKLVAGGTPHFGTVQLWDDGAENGLGRPYTEQERVDSMFEVSTPQLGATFTGDCQPDFLFAGTPTFLAEASLDDAARAKAAAAFKQLPDWATIQQDFLSYEGQHRRVGRGAHAARVDRARRRPDRAGHRVRGQRLRRVQRRAVRCVAGARRGVEADRQRDHLRRADGDARPRGRRRLRDLRGRPPWLRHPPVDVVAGRRQRRRRHRPGRGRVPVRRLRLLAQPRDRLSRPRSWAGPARPRVSTDRWRACAAPRRSCR